MLKVLMKVVDVICSEVHIIIQCFFRTARSTWPAMILKESSSTNASINTASTTPTTTTTTTTNPAATATNSSRGQMNSHSTSNHLYIKSVSPLATEQSVTEFLRQARLSVPTSSDYYERRAREDEDLSLAASERLEAAMKRSTDTQTVADDIEAISFIQ